MRIMDCIAVQITDAVRWLPGLLNWNRVSQMPGYHIMPKDEDILITLNRNLTLYSGALNLVDRDVFLSFVI